MMLIVSLHLKWQVQNVKWSLQAEIQIMSAIESLTMYTVEG